MTRSATARARRFHQGCLSGGRPQALDTWQVAMDDADVAVASLTYWVANRSRTKQEEAALPTNT
jgi:hypothetical protein